jgi:hypothetical protein
MADAQHKDRKFGSAQSINNSVQANPYPPESLPTASKRPASEWIGNQLLDCVNDLPAVILSNFRNIL